MIKRIISLFTVLIFLIGCNSGPIKKTPELNQTKTVTEKVKNTINLNDYKDPEKLKELVNSLNKNIWIIDVRTENEFVNGHIPMSKNFPKSEIKSRLNELPKNKYFILYCYSGARSGIASNILLENGYDKDKVMNWGGIRNWPYEKIKGK